MKKASKVRYFQVPDPLQETALDLTGKPEIHMHLPSSTNLKATVLLSEASEFNATLPVIAISINTGRQDTLTSKGLLDESDRSLDLLLGPAADGKHSPFRCLVLERNCTPTTLPADAIQH
eukprot:7450571-Karenia_brevis.AAC.1